MAKFPLFCLLFFIIRKNVDALECYVTDLAALKSRIADAEPIRKNCKTYFEEFGLGDLVGDEFRCTTVAAEAAEANMYIQGCLTSEDTCEELKSQTKSMQSIMGINFNTITCSECNTDYCNSGVSRSVVFKVRPYSGISRQTVFWISVLVGVGLMLICVTIAHFVKKNRSGAVYKV